MHVFLTGEVQIGKSTAISRFLASVPEKRVSGFKTVSRPRAGDGTLEVLLSSPDGSGAHVAGLRLGSGRYEGYPEVFDKYGPGLLDGAGDLVLMDEIGFMERHAARFSEAVLRTLDGSTPVLGVIKPKSTALLDEIRARRDVCVIEVNAQNRDLIPTLLGRLLFGAKGLSAIIVAAGLSSRMGSFKPLLPLGGKPMLRLAIDNMRLAGADEIIVVTGYRAQELRSIIADADAKEVHNPDYRVTGMYDSVKLGLRALGDSVGRVMLTPADNPAVMQSTYASLLGSNALIVRPSFEGNSGHPLIISGALIPYMLSYDGPMGMRGAVERSGFKIDEVAVNDPGITMDADTPEQYEKLKRWYELYGR